MFRWLAIAMLTVLVITANPPKHSMANPVNNSEAVTVQETEKPVEQEPVQPQVVEIPQPESTCASEIQKYDWNTSVATQVMLVESGGNHLIVNNNPNTGDYSIGCFQVNLYGSLASTRPSEDWLKVPANNVAYAYQLYAASGWSPWGFTTCKYKVKCY